MLSEIAKKSGKQAELLCYYKKQAVIYDKVRPPEIESYDEKINLIIKEGQITHDSKIVEIGVGTGKYLSKIVVDTGAKGIGIDKNQHMLSVAQTLISHNLKYINANATKVPLDSESVDICYAVNSIHQIEDKNALFNEIFRILKMNGKFIIITPDLERLDQFMLYKVSPPLLDYEKRRLPTNVFIKEFGKKHGLHLFKEITSKETYSQFISVTDFLFCIKNRFLSCLASFSNAEILDIVSQVEEYVKRNKLHHIDPYAYIAIILGKRES